jgi:hypothetical protein
MRSNYAIQLCDLSNIFTPKSPSCSSCTSKCVFIKEKKRKKKEKKKKKKRKKLIYLMSSAKPVRKGRRVQMQISKGCSPRLSSFWVDCTSTMVVALSIAWTSAIEDSSSFGLAGTWRSGPGVASRTCLKALAQYFRLLGPPPPPPHCRHHRRRRWNWQYSG